MELFSYFFLYLELNLCCKLLDVYLGWCLHVLQCSSEQKQLKGCEGPRAWPEWQGTASSMLKGGLCLPHVWVPHACHAVFTSI